MKSRSVTSQLVQASQYKQQTVACSIVDQLLKDLSVPVVFFYREPLDALVLVESLEVVLNDFSIFAGRLREVSHRLVLDCNNAGVRFSQQVESDSLEQLLQKSPTVAKKRLVDAIDPARAIATQGPVLTVKLTQFSDGGTALGLCWHHALGDMHTFMCFMKAWSAVASHQQYSPPLMLEDRAAYIQAQIPQNSNNTPNVRHLKGISLLKLAFYMLFQARSRSSASFYFSEDELSRMKQSFSQQANQKFSSNDVLCAHIGNWITRFDSDPSDRQIAIAVNYRSRTKLSNHALGNFIGTILLPISKRPKPHQLSQTIRDAVDSFKERHLGYFSTCKYIEENGGIANISRFVSKAIDPINKTLLITNWSRFGVYDILFSRSKPFYFASLSIAPFPWLSAIFEGCSNQGLIYSAVLPAKLMRRLTQTDALQELHQYRNPDDVLPTALAQLPWLL